MVYILKRFKIENFYFFRTAERFLFARDTLLSDLASVAR